MEHCAIQKKQCPGTTVYLQLTLVAYISFACNEKAVEKVFIIVIIKFLKRLSQIAILKV